MFPTVRICICGLLLLVVCVPVLACPYPGAVVGGSEDWSPSKDAAVYDVSARTGVITVQANANQEVVLNLPSNPTTGYSWQVLTDLTTLSNLQYDGCIYTSQHRETGRVGAGGIETWGFTPVAGNLQLKLVYVRSWEFRADPVGTVKDSNTLTIDISVQ